MGESVRPSKQERLRQRKEAAAYLRESWGIPTSDKTLAKLAVIGGGPVFRKAGRVPLYPEDGLDEHARKKLSPRVASTSELKRAGAGIKSSNSQAA